NWPPAGPNASYFASSDVWNALETASGPPAQPQQAAFESGLSQISNLIYLEKFLPTFTSIPTGPTIGGRSATARNIYAVRLADAHRAGGTTIQGYCTIGDNTTTTLVGQAPTANYSSANFSLQPHHNVNPPIGPTGQMTVVDSGVAVDTTSFLGRLPQAGYWAFKITCVYRDGTESRSSMASGPALMTGLNTGYATNIPVGQSINGVDVVFRRVYGSVFSNPLGSRGVPDFGGNDSCACVWVINDNTITTLTFNFGSAVTGGEHTPNNIPPGEEDLPGPDLESLIAPEDIDDNSELLLLDPPITMTSDTSQLRNRIYVKGKGTIIAADAAIDATSTPQAILLPEGLKQPILQANWLYGGGQPILPFIVVDDIASQKFYGSLELDNDGNPTDGIHEYTISDDGLTNLSQMYGRALAELKMFSRPIVTLRYSTRDSLSKAGKVVHVDLNDPPITGDFIIQEVTIDQFHDESDDLTPRYNVVADSAARFNLNDLLLKLSESVDESAGGSSSGVISTAVNTAGNNAAALILASQTSAVQVLDIVLTDTDLINSGTTPIIVLSGAPGVVYFPLYWSYIMDKNAQTWTNGGTSLQLQYTSGTDTICGTLSLALNNGNAQTIVAANIGSAFTLQSVASGHTTVGDGLRIRTAAVLARLAGPPVSQVTNIRIKIAYYVFTR